MKNRIRAGALALAIAVAAVIAAPTVACAQTAAPRPAAPRFTDSAALIAWLKQATLNERLKVYASYFSSADINPSATTAIGAWFGADLAAAPSASRKDLAARAVKTAKSPPKGTRKDQAPDIGGFETFLRALRETEETADVFYAALPFGVAGHSEFDDVSLGGKRAAVLKAVLGGLKSRLTPAGKRMLLEETMRWPWLLGAKDYDARAVRDCALLLYDSSVDFFTALEAPRGGLETLAAKSFLDQKPADAEYAYLLPGLMEFTAVPSLEEPITRLRLKKGKAWDDLGKTVLGMRGSSNERLKAVANFLAFLASGKPEDAAAIAVPIDAAAGMPDDWTAFVSYRVAQARGETPSRDALLACLDPKRPSLAAAAIEDRWSAEYLDPEKLIAAFDPSLVGKDPFDASVIQKCIPLAKASSERALIPPMYAVVHLGKAKYIESVAVLIDAPRAYLREFMAQTLLRFADARFYGFFLRRLYDEDGNVRLLCIKGLGAIRDSRGVEPLAKILNDPAESYWIRTACAQAIGSIGDRRAIQIFTSYLVAPPKGTYPDIDLRIYAAQYLGSKKERTAVDALVKNIDPTQENMLNFACMEALGRINDTAGFAKLLPVFSKGWKAWFEGDDVTPDNFYAGMWALFTYRSAPLAAISAEAFDSGKGGYADKTYAAAYYLVRNSKEQKPEWADYCALHRAAFFESYRRVYEYAVLLNKSWDRATLLFLMEQADRYDEATQSWLLSGVAENPSREFAPFLAELRDSESESVRGWVAHLACVIARQLPASPSEEELETGKALRRLVDGWRAGETNSAIASWLASARQAVERFSAE